MARPRSERLTAEVRKQKILEAALRLFARRGFEETKTRAIADEAGISEAAMFKHFKSKEDLITRSLEYQFGCPHREHKAAFEAFTSNLDALPEEAMKRAGLAAYALVGDNIDLVRFAIYSIMKHPDKMRAYLKENTREEERVFKNMVARGMRRGIIKRMDADIVGPLFPLLMTGMAVADVLIKGRPASARRRKHLVDTLVEIYVRGIARA